MAFIDDLLADGLFFGLYCDETSGTTAFDIVGSQDGTYVNPTTGVQLATTPPPSRIGGLNRVRFIAPTSSTRGWCSKTSGFSRPDAGDFWMECWVQTESPFTAITPTFFGTSSDSPEFDIVAQRGCSTYKGESPFVQGDSATINPGCNNLGLDDGEWHQYVLVVDLDTNVRTYVDGVLVRTISTAVGPVVMRAYNLSHANFSGVGLPVPTSIAFAGMGTGLLTDEQVLIHFEGSPEPEPAPEPGPVTIAPIARRGTIGCGIWTAQIVDRGGGVVRHEFTGDISMSRILNGTGQANVSFAPTQAGGWNGAMKEAEPWRHELLLYRDRELAFVGPVTSKSTKGTFTALDLFAWMDVRILEEDFHGGGDAADVFKAIFDLAYGKDPSPNIDISTRRTGVDVIRDLRGVEFRKAADALRELSRTGLDFTMVGRKLLAGGDGAFLSNIPLKLHDDGVNHNDLEVVFEGANLASDVAVFGSTEEAGGVPFTGRATRAVSVYGLVQRSFTELLIKDRESADANALARLEGVQPTPIRVNATLTEQAAMTFGELIPGRRVDCRLRDVNVGLEVMQTLRLQSVNVTTSTGAETVKISLVPLGVTTEDG